MVVVFGWCRNIFSRAGIVCFESSFFSSFCVYWSCIWHLVVWTTLLYLCLSWGVFSIRLSKIFLIQSIPFVFCLPYFLTILTNRYIVAVSEHSHVVDHIARTLSTNNSAHPHIFYWRALFLSSIRDWKTYSLAWECSLPLS